MTPCCYVKRIIDKFLAMNAQEMEYVYLISKDQLFVKEAYEQAKLIREKQKTRSEHV
jgi:hypothetical protein